MLEIIQGFHVFEPSELPRYEPGRAPLKNEVSPVWMIEEKQTDVNIALHVYRDAGLGHSEQLVICSNDSDLEPSLAHGAHRCPCGENRLGDAAA